MSNLFWGMQFRTCRIFWDFADHQSSLNPKKSYKYKSHTAITSIVVALATNLKIKCESLQKFLLRFAFAKSRIPLYLVIARFGYAESWQSTKNNPCVSTNRISPDSWCKKSESKGAVVPPADFLLESELRGSPPKSEKRQLLARRGSGAGGAALLRKETSESKKQNGDFIVGFIKITDSIHLGFNP